MKVKEAQISRALDNPDGAIRLYLLYGPDDAGSRALAMRLDRSMGSDSERIDFDGATLKDDPARLADEAASISLFGGRRHIRVIGGDECTAAVASLLEATVTGDPVVLIAGALKPTSTLLKRALDDARVMACANYKAEGSSADELAVTLGRTHGLRLTRMAAHQLASTCLGDRAILERELEKIALYLDAGPDRPRDCDIDILEVIGAGLGEADTSAMVDAMMTGNLGVLAREINIMSEATTGPIPVLRGVGRRLLLLARLRAEVDSGKSVGTVIASAGKSLFFKEKDSVAAQLGRWDSSRLQTAAHRVFEIEQDIKKTRTAGEVLAVNELIAIGRVAERLR
ncbi:MAG: polymerase subunit delta [Sphingomonadales bacterium]|nr:polymerase subunit delta [Sphingomonadales bacterium]